MRKSLLLIFVAGALAGMWLDRTAPVRGDRAQQAGPAASALLDAKRKAAQDLAKDGKYAEAAALIQEVIRADDLYYADHLQLARIYDRAGAGERAAAEFRRTLVLLPSPPRAEDQRQAKAEAEKRCKALEPWAVKVDALVEEFTKKVDAAEREAIDARAMLTLQRLFRLRAGLWVAVGRPECGSAEVAGNDDNGALVMVLVHAGRTYRVRAAGVWRMGNVECTADGTTAVPPNGNGRLGQLVTNVGGKIYALGSNTTFVPAATAPMYVMMNDNTNRATNSGALQVLVEPEP